MIKHYEIINCSQGMTIDDAIKLLKDRKEKGANEISLSCHDHNDWIRPFRRLTEKEERQEKINALKSELEKLQSEI